MNKLLSVLLLSTMLGGCSLMHPATAPIPGAANQFDSDTYLTLVTAKGVIDQTKLDLGNNAFPAAWVPNVKKAVNGAVTAYNVADLTYQEYHTSALAGKATPTQQLAVNSAMNNLNQAVSSVAAAKAGN